MSGSLQRGVAVAATVVLLAALGWTILRPAGQYRVTAWFTQTVGLYPGSDVRILGIPVGSVTDVVPEGDRVRVDMLIDDDYDIPADADAVVLAPSLVSDRYVQFSPVYDGGEKMKDGAKVPLERTATPVELDQVYGALDQLSAALGPNGANKNGALSDLVDVGAANLDGNGEALNRTLTGFSQAVETLADHRDDLFSSLDNLQTFTSRAGHHRRAGGPVQRQHGRRRRPAGPGAGGPRRGGLAAQQGAGRRRRVRAATTRRC